MTSKGRQSSGDRHAQRTKPEAFPKGERHYAARLTADQVRLIRKRVENNEKQVDLAKEYGVLKTTINSIVKGRNWKSVT
jgi:DNA-binding XRE family transcriptional regulator